MSNIVKLVHTSDLDTQHFHIDEDARKIRIRPELLGDKTPAGLVTNLKFDSATSSITWQESGVAKTYDMSAFLTDIKVTGHTFLAGVLTLTQDNGPSIEVDLNKLAEITTSNTGNVKFTGKGTAADPLVANVDVPTYTASLGVKKVGNDFQLDKSAFDVEIKDAFGQKTVGYLLSSNT